MKTIGFELLSKEDGELLLDEVHRICSNYQIPLEKLTIVISNRMKSSMGGKVLMTKMSREMRRYGSAKITLPLSYYQTFGFDNILKTLRHELAHIIAFHANGHGNHDRLFKTICSNLGGHMNKKLAGKTYKEYATDEFLETPFRFLYTCPDCGKEYKRRRMFNKKITSGGRCKICGAKAKEFYMEKI
jgi:predicted SprT family Zn-dependent metalloprotease